jgi:hypothetical protein
MLRRNLVKRSAPRLWVEPLDRLDHIGHANFGENLQIIGHSFSEHLQESKLGCRE